MTITQRLARRIWLHFERHGWPSWVVKWQPKVLGWYMGSKGERVR